MGQKSSVPPPAEVYKNPMDPRSHSTVKTSIDGPAKMSNEELYIFINNIMERTYRTSSDDPGYIQTAIETIQVLKAFMMKFTYLGREKDAVTLDNIFYDLILIKEGDPPSKEDLINTKTLVDENIKEIFGRVTQRYKNIKYEQIGRNRRYGGSRKSKKSHKKSHKKSKKSHRKN